MKKILFALPLLIISLITPPAMAASDADCAIWLCLPTGFPSGCGDAKSAFKKRIKHLKPPLPNISSCLVKESDIPPEIKAEYKPSDLSYKKGVSAKMPDGRFIDGTSCIRHRNNGGVLYWSPRGCIATYHWVQVHMDKQPYANKYYY